MEEKIKVLLNSNISEEKIAGYYISTKLLILNPKYDINYKLFDTIFISRMLISNDKNDINLGRKTAINLLSVYLTNIKSFSNNDNHFELFLDNNFILIKTLLNTLYIHKNKDESDSEAILRLTGETLSIQKVKIYIHILLKLLPITLLKPFRSNSNNSGSDLKNKKIPNKIEESAYIFLNMLNDITARCPSCSFPLLQLKSDDMRKHLRDLFVICFKSSKSTVELQSKTLTIMNGIFEKVDIGFTVEDKDVNNSKSKGHGAFATLVFSSTIAEIHSLSAKMTNYVDNMNTRYTNTADNNTNEDLTSDDFQMKWFTCCDLLDKFLSFLVDDGLDDSILSKDNDDDRCGIWGAQLPPEVILNFRSMIQRLSESTMHEVNTSLKKLRENNEKQKDKDEMVKEVWKILVTRMAESLSAYGFTF